MHTLQDKLYASDQPQISTKSFRVVQAVLLRFGLVKLAKRVEDNRNLNICAGVIQGCPEAKTKVWAQEMKEYPQENKEFPPGFLSKPYFFYFH
jgi:hypothetical protein